MRGKIYYTNIERYKYRVKFNYSIDIGIKGYDIDLEDLRLTPDGILTLKAGFMWDGPSGPTYDSKTGIRGSGIHDGGYKLIRLELLPPSCKEVFDTLFHDILLTDGMSHGRADLWFTGVHKFGEGSCIPGSEREEILMAP